MRFHKCVFAIATATLLIAGVAKSASATVQQANDIVLVPYANSSVENPLAFAASYGTISSVCATVVYIAAEDKQIFATALAAQVNGIHVNIKYEDNASTVTYPTGSSWPGTVLHCKLLTIWVAKTVY
jgi:hypothetical protein